jgi:hypothetical protein
MGQGWQFLKQVEQRSERQAYACVRLSGRVQVMCPACYRGHMPLALM